MPIQCLFIVQVLISVLERITVSLGKILVSLVPPIVRSLIMCTTGISLNVPSMQYANTLFMSLVNDTVLFIYSCSWQSFDAIPFVVVATAVYNKAKTNMVMAQRIMVRDFEISSLLAHYLDVIICHCYCCQLLQQGCRKRSDHVLTKFSHVLFKSEHSLFTKH